MSGAIYLCKYDIQIVSPHKPASPYRPARLDQPESATLAKFLLITSTAATCLKFN
jgi:hypothetical protein